MKRILPNSDWKKKVIEKKTIFGGSNHFEFSIHNTNVQARGVLFKSTNPLYCGMILGKKIVHSENQAPFAFVRGESILLPANKELEVDFPHADLNSPTKCLKIEIDANKLNEIITYFNEQLDQTHEAGKWLYEVGQTHETSTWQCEDNHHLHFSNISPINKILEEMVWISQEEMVFRSALMELKVIELVIRMLQFQSVVRLLRNSEYLMNYNPLANLTEYIKAHLENPLPVEVLAREAHMSTAQLFRHFQHYFGMTPVQYMNELRINKAKHLLRNPRILVTEVCYMIGLSSLSYFIQLFKRKTGLTPKQYQKNANINIPIATQ